MGRSTLERTLASIRGQELQAGDEVLVVSDGHYDGLAQRWKAAGLPGKFVELPAASGDWGHTPRNIAIPLASGDYILSVDDDDIFAPGAFRKVREAVRMNPGRPQLFRFCDHKIGGNSHWKQPVLRLNDVGTPCLVYPNRPGKFGTWAPYRGGDFVFIKETCDKYPEGPVWREEIIVITRPE
jgi:glycosyltransferase involved in cell wall biosynthesis